MVCSMAGHCSWVVGRSILFKTTSCGLSRKPGLIIAGSILMGVGTIAGLGTAALMSADNAEAGPIVGLGVLTISSLAVGIPLFVVGMKKRPVRDAFLELPIEASPIPQIGIGPTGGSATWHF